MPKFVVNATGQAAEHVGGANWLEALGTVLTRMGLLSDLEALACEILPNETVVARNVKTGQGFVVMRVEGEGTPAPAVRRAGRTHEPFGVQNLVQSVFQENLSYELRAPLNNILGYSGMLMEEASDHGLPRMAEDLRRITQSAQGLLALVDASLEANRLNRDEVKIQRLTFRVVELLEDAAAAFGPEAARRRNRVEVRSDDLGEMRADPTRLRMALIEMLGWCNERVSEGVIALDAAVENDAENTEWVWLTVRDGGPAPTDAEVSALFQVLAGNSGTEGAAAASIRRSTARELVRKQGGDLGWMAREQGALALQIRIPRGR